MACTPEETKPENEPKKEKTEENIIVTEDEAITFKIINTRNVPKKDLEGLKKEILDAYNILKESIETDYIPAENINIHLLKGGNEASTGYREDIKLRANDISQYPIVHEMTHTILGYGENFGSTRGFFTQEGFATYMENEYGKSIGFYRDFSPHKIMRFFIDKNINIPLYKLIDTGYDDTFFRPVFNDPSDFALRLMSYAHAGSFTTYLIDTYGLEKFEQVYNKADLDRKFVEVYGETNEELEKDWLSFIKENTSKITAEDKNKVNNFGNINALFDSIEPDLFER